LKIKVSANKYKEEVNMLTLLLVIGIILFVLFLAGLSSTCYRSNSHNYLTTTGDIQGLLAIPAFK